MARIVLTCWGSHGDIDPFLGLGLALRGRGHDVALATDEYYRALVESSGLAFRAIRPRLDPTDSQLIERIMDRTRGSEFLLTEILFPSVEAMFDDVRAAAEGADLLISHPITFATPIVAEHLGIPWASVVLAPTSMFSAYDIPAVPPAPWLKSLERLGHWPGALIMRLIRLTLASWPAPAYRLRERLGLPRGANPILEGQHSPILVLALYSKVLGTPQPDWPPNTVVTGHMFHDAPHGTALSQELEAFLQDGPAPIVFTLGSSVVLIAKDFWKESIGAVRRLGARAVLLVGPEKVLELRSTLAAGGYSGPASGVIAVERAPHSLLFPRASVVVNQCGIGTMAQILRSGRPMLAVPYSHDQPDNAWRARKLGMARTIYPRHYRAPRVANSLRTLIEDPRYGSAAARVAAEVRAEDGVRVACDAIERRFGLAAVALGSRLTTAR